MDVARHPDIGRTPAAIFRGAEPGENVQKAQEHIQSRRIYERVSVDGFDRRRLLCVDNMANLIVVEDPGALEMDEIVRILCPGGTVWVWGI